MSLTEACIMANDSENGKGRALPRGTYSRIARRLKVTPQHVRAVALGMGKSKRVSKALERVLASLEDSAQAS